MDDTKIKELIKKLKHGEHFIIPESDYGKAEVWRIGGTPVFYERFSSKEESINLMIKTVNSWS